VWYNEGAAPYQGNCMAPALMTRFAVSMLPAFYELSGKEGKEWFLELLWYQAALGKDGVLEHTRIDK